VDAIAFSSLFDKPLDQMTNEEKVAALAEIEAMEKHLTVSVAELKDADPFYFYEPSDGSLTDDAKVFLKEYLREEDIPVKCDSQLDAHMCDADTIGFFGGNQGGKTTWLTIEALIHATGELPYSLIGKYPASKMPQERYRSLRIEGESDQQLSDVLIPSFRRWTPRAFLAGGLWENSWSAKANCLSIVKDGKEIAKIQFNSFTQEVSRLQGKKLTFVGYDEEPPSSHREENLFRFTTSKRIQERFSMTPTKGMTWIKEAILDKQDGKKVRCFKMASVANRFANLDVLRVIVEKLDNYQTRKMRLLGEFVSLSGLIYGGRFNRSIHVIEPFPVGCTCLKFQESGEHHEKCAHRRYMVVRGMDVHTVTPPAVVELAIDPMGDLFVCGVYNPHHCPDMDQLKEALAQRVEDRKYRLRWTIVDKSLDYDMKSASGLNLFKKLIRGKNRIRPLHKSEKFSGSIMVGVDEIKDLLKVNPLTGKPRLQFFDLPEVQPLINDIETLERETYQDEDKKGPKDAILEGKKHRHAALRYITQRKLTWQPMDAVQYVPQDFEDEERFI
jgi:hypothetical protein